MLVDIQTKQIINLQMYCGKEEDSPEKNQGFRVCRDLLVRYFERNTPVNLVIDNFFTSLKLCYFLGHYGGTLLGTIAPIRVEVPEDMKNKKDREPVSTIVKSKGSAK